MHSTKFPRTPFVTMLAASVLLFTVPLHVVGQVAATGTVEGRVSNSVAGLYLKQVRVARGTSVQRPRPDRPSDWSVATTSSTGPTRAAEPFAMVTA